MGVLDARADAEKVGYPVVGEEAKEASNVIDYNINEEITKDTSAVSNANNDTTTGMATVIPGINAPKLIASTSIIGDIGGGGGKSFVEYTVAIQTNSGQTYQLTDLNIVSDEGLGLTAENGVIKVGKDGVYIIYLNFGLTSISSGTFTLYARRNGTDFLVCSGSLNSIASSNISVYLYKGDLITLFCKNNTAGAVFIRGTSSISFM